MCFSYGSGDPSTATRRSTSRGTPAGSATRSSRTPTSQSSSRPVAAWGIGSPDRTRDAGGGQQKGARVPPRFGPKRAREEENRPRALARAAPVHKHKKDNA